MLCLWFRVCISLLNKKKKKKKKEEDEDEDDDDDDDDDEIVSCIVKLLNYHTSFII
jgi:hypothetical protein